MRDCPYGICCPWVRGGWDLDALGKFFRRRRRRRRRRPLLFRQILEQNHNSQLFLMKMTFWNLFYLEGRFLGHILELYRTRRKRLYILQEIHPRWLQMKKCFFMKNWG